MLVVAYNYLRHLKRNNKTAEKIFAHATFSLGILHALEVSCRIFHVIRYSNTLRHRFFIEKTSLIPTCSYARKPNRTRMEHSPIVNALYRAALFSENRYPRAAALYFPPRSHGAAPTQRTPTCTRAPIYTHIALTHERVEQGLVLLLVILEQHSSPPHYLFESRAPG